MAARHHTVPQFYLRNFADLSGQLLLVDRDSPDRSVRTSVGNAAAEVGFYRIEASDLARESDAATFDPESIEAGLSHLEAAIAPAIRSLVEGGIEAIDQHDWYRLVQFTALQTARGHRWRKDFGAMATQAVRMDVLSNLNEDRVRSWLADRGQPSGPADVAAFVDGLASRFPRVLPPQAVLVQESLKMALGNPETGDLGLGRYLADKKVDLVRTVRSPVLTGDEPVCWWSPGDEPIGYATAQVVWVPLSPRLILQFRAPTFDMVEHGLPDTASPDGHDQLVSVVNRLIASQAERWIIHHPDDAPLRGMDLPRREVWGDEVVAVLEDERSRREFRIHRRLR